MQMHLFQPMQRVQPSQSFAHLAAHFGFRNSAVGGITPRVDDLLTGYTRVNDLLTLAKSIIYTSWDQPALAQAASVAVCEELSFDSFSPEVT